MVQKRKKPWIFVKKHSILKLWQKLYHLQRKLIVSACSSQRNFTRHCNPHTHHTHTHTHTHTPHTPLEILDYRFVTDFRITSVTGLPPKRKFIPSDNRDTPHFFFAHWGKLCQYYMCILLYLFKLITLYYHLSSVSARNS